MPRKGVIAQSTRSTTVPQHLETRLLQGKTRGNGLPQFIVWSCWCSARCCCWPLPLCSSAATKRSFFPTLLPRLPCRLHQPAPQRRVRVLSGLQGSSPPPRPSPSVAIRRHQSPSVTSWHLVVRSIASPGVSVPAPVLRDAVARRHPAAPRRHGLGLVVGPPPALHVRVLLSVAKRPRRRRRQQVVGPELGQRRQSPRLDGPRGLPRMCESSLSISPRPVSQLGPGLTSHLLRRLAV